MKLKSKLAAIAGSAALVAGGAFAVPNALAATTWHETGYGSDGGSSGSAFINLDTERYHVGGFKIYVTDSNGRALDFSYDEACFSSGGSYSSRSREYTVHSGYTAYPTNPGGYTYDCTMDVTVYVEGTAYDWIKVTVSYK